MALVSHFVTRHHSFVARNATHTLSLSARLLIFHGNMQCPE